MTCPHCGNDDPRLLDVDGRLVQCRVCAKSFTVDVRSWPARLACLWHGHADVTTVAGRRVALRCLTCGRETAGWMLDRPRPVPLGRPHG